MARKDDARITLGHGGGGTLTQNLIHSLFRPLLSNPILDTLDDGAVLPSPTERIAISTDSFVVSPLFFNGGDIGSLAVNGTVNDVAVSGAHPRYLAMATILEEGLSLAVLERIVSALARAARRANVTVIAGDTKVVQRGKGDQIFITTTGVGMMRDGFPRVDRRLAANDAILVSGPVGDHGAVILAAREDVELQTSLQSDCAPVTRLVAELFNAGIVPLFMRDPTRGGLCGVLCDLADHCQLGVEVIEAEVPIRPEVMAICEIVGTDPYHLACEGRVVAVVPDREAEQALAIWRACEQGQGAALIGRLVSNRPGQVVLQTRYGGKRVLQRPTAELLPRIC